MQSLLTLKKELCIVNFLTERSISQVNFAENEQKFKYSFILVILEKIFLKRKCGLSFITQYYGKQHNSQLCKE